MYIILRLLSCSEAVKSILKHATRLEHLDVSFLALSDEGILNVIILTAHAYLHPLSCIYSNINIGFKNMGDHSSMLSLVLRGNEGLTDATLFEVSRNMPSLQLLNLWKCPNITDEGMVYDEWN